MSKPQAAPPSPSSDEDGHQGYFLGRVSPLKSPSHKPKPIRKVNPALFKVNFAHLIEQKQQWYAAHGSSPSVEDSPEPIQETVEDDIPLIDESIHLPSRPKGTHRRKGVSRHVNPKHRKKARGNNPNDPITIDLSPSRPSTSRAVHDQRVQDSRATLKSRRDHISTVAQPILRFPHMDFIDRPGLAAAHGDPYPVDPAGDPWPNSIVSFPPVNHSLNLPCPHIPRSPWMKVLHLVTSTWDPTDNRYGFFPPTGFISVSEIYSSRRYLMSTFCMLTEIFKLSPPNLSMTGQPLICIMQVFHS